MFRAWRVIIGKDHNIGAGEERHELVGPLASAHCIACRGAPNRDHRIGAFLAFGDENGFTLRYSFDKLRQFLGYLANTFYTVDIAFRCFVSLKVAFDCLPVLANVAIFEAAHLEQPAAEDGKFWPSV
jgi:hypothetical protein